MTIKTVAVLGAGVLGSQIAFQTAFHGFDVIAYDVSSEALTKSHTTIAWMIEQMAKDQLGTEYDSMPPSSASASPPCWPMPCARRIW
jgi:3-hydroxybutyryl-CoA dehydrogenase